MSDMVNVPGDVDAVTAEWLTDALAQAQPGTAVTSMAVEQVIHGSLTKVLLAVDFAENPHEIHTEQETAPLHDDKAPMPDFDAIAADPAHAAPGAHDHRVH